jgi:8-oxo-dGTP pyrophosphatase MutT (NUDIX family)
VSRRQRVVAYVTRERDGVKELLVFDHCDDPSAGTQVPAGRVDPGETLEECLTRELDEEAGLRGRIVRELRRPDWPAKYENHAYELRSREVKRPIRGSTKSMERVTTPAWCLSTVGSR